ncbi:hypothetical protein J437_LFUL003824 [Ladona fulva]|uniref:LisH domain-containing protein n=1 Tax=Ladona fulva TaxID=123851 RepID=A0A8K0KEF4_LADFU|nr:hypothetical protein J437_LFUL003824 [Ladona fulva]
MPGLRTYLRHQLISALKRTHLSSDYLNKKRNNLSIKDASLNLLIAEYLVLQNYQYTASIFYSEEPRLGQLPIQLKLPNEGGDSSKFFTENEVEEILESLNMVHSSKFVREVIDTYSKHSTSLLKAIVKSIAGQSKNFQHKKPDSSGDAFAVRRFSVNFMETEEEYSTINQSNERNYVASAEKVNKLQVFKNQGGKSIVQDKEKSSSSSENKQSDIDKRVEDAVMKMKGEMEREMAEQRKSMEDGLMVKQQRIIEMVNHLQDQQVKLQDCFKNIQEKEELLDVKEKRFEGIQRQESIRIAEEHNEIKSSQQKLEEEFQR